MAKEATSLPKDDESSGSRSERVPKDDERSSGTRSERVPKDDERSSGNVITFLENVIKFRIKVGQKIFISK